MVNKSRYYKAGAMLAATLLFGVAAADQHTSQALEHAIEAVDSMGDSKALGEHAADALKHIEAAKIAHDSHPGIIKQLDKAEADLKSAVKNASLFNTDTASRDVMDARIHLKAADTAAQRLEAGKIEPKAADK